MTKTKYRGSGQSAGCLALFALPFAAVGVGMTIWLAITLFEWLSAQNWTETPAQIVRAELKVHHGRKSDSYEVKAEYLYEYGNQKFKSDQIGLTSGADNIGSFHQAAYQQLSEYQKSRKPFRCYVNPSRPTEAVLYRDLRWEFAAFQMLFVLAFGGIGFGLLIGGWLAWRKQRANAALVAANPETPWMWKSEWATGRIISSSKSMMVGLVSFALFWNVVSAPLWFVLPREIIEKGNRFALLGLLFPLVGGLLAWGAIVSALRWRKFGESVLRMASVPGIIGGQLAGVVQTSVKIHPEDGFNLKLLCLRRITRGSGKSRSTSEEAVWDEEQVIGRELLDETAGRSAIPVVFRIPYECLPTDDTVANDQTLWQLEMTAKVPGLDYSATFEVPVFKTPQSDPNFVVDEQPSSEYVAPANPDRDLHEAGVRKTISPDGNGCLFVFPMGRNLVGNMFPSIFWLIWCGAFVFLLHIGAPMVFTVSCGIFALLLSLFVVDLWFYRSVVDVSPRGMAITGGLFGMGTTRWVDKADIKKIEPWRGMSSGQNIYYNVVVVRGDGTWLKAGKRLRGHHSAVSVIQQIEQAMAV